MSPVLVGLDIGTTSVKGVAIDADAAVLAVAYRDYALSTPQPEGPSRIPRTGTARPS